MSPKPVDLDRGLATLRAERPPADATERARLALIPPSPPGPLSKTSPLQRGRKSLARPLAFAMIATALALVVLTPRTRAGAAWAQTLSATLDAPFVHTVTRNAKGMVVEESWRANRKRAQLAYAEDGRLMSEMREDGRRRFSFFDHAIFGRPTPLNGVSYGLRYDTRDRSGPTLNLASLEKTLASPEITVAAHLEADASKGLPERYELRFKAYPSIGYKVEVDPGARRIKRLLWPGRPPTDIDYPASIASSVFEPRPQAAKSVTVYDLEAQKVIVARRLREGLGRQGPVTLRLVTLDAEGGLWAFWTGAPPSRDLKPALRLPGVKTAPPFGMRMFTRDWATATTAKGNPHWKPGTPHLGGMGLVPKSRIGTTVDLDVPYAGGTARFRRIPVLRIAGIVHFDGELGVERTYRKRS